MLNEKQTNLILELKELVLSSPDILTTDTHKKAKELIESLSKNGEEAEEIETIIINLSERVSPKMKVYLFALATFVRFSKDCYDKLIDICMSDAFDIFEKQFLYQQLYTMRLFHISLVNSDNAKKLWIFHREIVNGFKELLKDSLEPIDVASRNKDLVLVITDQMLSFEHGPSKTTADRCKILIEHFNKKVLLINTAESLNRVGDVPIFGQKIGSYAPDYLEKEYIEWKGCRIPYFQCDKNMPDIDTMRYLIGVIKQLKPMYGLAIGVAGVFAQIVDEIIPVLTVGLSPTTMVYTETKYQTYSKELSKDEAELLEYMGKGKDHIIKSVFSSSIVEKTKSFTRQELGLGESDFVLLIVGGRLDDEIDEDIQRMLKKLCDSHSNIQIMIIGSFGSNGKLEDLDLYDELKDRIHYFGMVTEVLSYMSVCDLYVNPVRVGGGTSCVEALSVGIPVVTVKFGDVAQNAGDNYTVEDYGQMYICIERYMKDKEFYDLQVEKGLKRAEYMLDSDARFSETIEEFERRIGI